MRPHHKTICKQASCTHSNNKKRVLAAAPKQGRRLHPRQKQIPPCTSSSMNRPRTKKTSTTKERLLLSTSYECCDSHGDPGICEPVDSDAHGLPSLMVAKGLTDCACGGALTVVLLSACACRSAVYGCTAEPVNCPGPQTLGFRFLRLGFKVYGTP